MKKRRKKRRKLGRFFAFCVFVTLIIICVHTMMNFLNENINYSSPLTSADVNAKITQFAQEHNLSINDWPEELIDLMQKNPETEEFVLNYPIKKNIEQNINLDKYSDSSTVPLLLQWDERWGYFQYGENIMAISGCGPTCLSMVSIYLLNDGKYNPKYIAEFSEENGYCVPGNGSAWALISEGGEKLGLDVVEIPLDENRIKMNLEVGNPIICVVGPGDFTTTGHFIVLTDYENGKIKLNDPNSILRSNKLWDFNNIKNQIQVLWVCR